MRRIFLVLSACLICFGLHAQRGLSEYEYWIDDGVRISGTMAVVEEFEHKMLLDTKQLPIGIHTFHYRAQDTEGNWSALGSWIFYRMELRDSLIVNKGDVFEYWFDNDASNPILVSLIDNEVSFTVDVSNLSEGVHTLVFRVRDVLGNYSVTQSWLFFKNMHPRGGRIAWYKTWWNNHYDEVETVEIDADTTDYVFTQQIEVPEYAKTDGFSRNSTARFNVVFGDDTGNSSRIESFIISYPDNIPPVSTIEIAEQTSEQVSLKWYANENDIMFYNVYVSEDNKPFVLWMPNTSVTNATFKKKDGISYRFLVTARDKAGNIEKYDETKCIMVNR